MHKVDSPFDAFAIKTVYLDKVITGHLPHKKFLLNRGAVTYKETTLTHYERSPIMQGGLEILCKVTVKLHGTVKNHMLLGRYM